MKRYAVVGASSGVGREIVARLASQGASVRAISRSPLAADGLVEPYAADVTDASALHIPPDNAAKATRNPLNTRRFLRFHSRCCTSPHSDV